jgi:hypothetical protein
MLLTLPLLAFQSLGGFLGRLLDLSGALLHLALDLLGSAFRLQFGVIDLLANLALGASDRILAFAFQSVFVHGTSCEI